MTCTVRRILGLGLGIQFSDLDPLSREVGGALFGSSFLKRRVL
jgi:hypothetical protein